MSWLSRRWDSLSASVKDLSFEKTFDEASDFVADNYNYLTSETFTTDLSDFGEAAADTVTYLATDTRRSLLFIREGAMQGLSSTAGFIVGGASGAVTGLFNYATGYSDELFGETIINHIVGATSAIEQITNSIQKAEAVALYPLAVAENNLFGPEGKKFGTDMTMSLSGLAAFTEEMADPTINNSKERTILAVSQGVAEVGTGILSAGVGAGVSLWLATGGNIARGSQAFTSVITGAFAGTAAPVGLAAETVFTAGGNIHDQFEHRDRMTEAMVKLFAAGSISPN